MLPQISDIKKYDADFKAEDINILTANKKLLKIP